MTERKQLSREQIALRHLDAWMNLEDAAIRYTELPTDHPGSHRYQELRRGLHSAALVYAMRGACVCEEYSAMTPERIKELRALCGATTRGPWYVGHAVDGVFGVDGPFICDARMPDNTFIAAARNALPEALDEVERLRAEIEKIKAQETELWLSHW